MARTEDGGTNMASSAWDARTCPVPMERGRTDPVRYRLAIFREEVMKIYDAVGVIVLIYVLML